MHIRKGDMVLVLTGEYAGSRGRVLRVFPKKGRALVEGVNMVKRHTRARRPGEQSGILEKEAPIHASNLMVICPRCGQPTRVKKEILEDGSRVRACRKCGEML
ncbi:MAG: 50S ribosomal protein L24 [Candidatus Latescibacterota bacterium]|nr:MAG: 50S ribosomal protein L24 [Candidatus Latescibacterota bacterium]RKY71691.1 MAG: 50S ribosomal protein L24 [Candidatus Latescibacterota bacterium]HDH99649.1 50S ribosomal protein L24 [Bacillota bacterium]